MARPEAAHVVKPPIGELALLAGQHGVETSYTDWRGADRPVSADSLVAVLGALGVAAATPAQVAGSLAELAERNRTRMLPPVVVCGAGPDGRLAEVHRNGVLIAGTELLVGGAEAPARVAVVLGSGRVFELPPGEPAPACGRTRLVHGAATLMFRYVLPPAVPAGWHRIEAQTRSGRTETAALLVTRPAEPLRGRAYGLMAQLYSVRSRGSWGLGDLRDLADLASWSGTALGAGFVLVNPLHAGEPRPPLSASPYLPMSRRYASPLYLRVEDVPEYAMLDAAGRAAVDRLGGELPARADLAAELDRDAAWTAKSRALELLHQVRRPAARERAYAAYLRREGAALTGFATWCALAERHGPDWRRWPAALRDPAAGTAGAPREAATGAGELAARVELHTWLQWQVDQQLAAAQAAATAAGMPIGVIHDLAVGVHPGGADAWLHQGLLAPGMSVGAPPDEFNQRGQDWGQPPWHPGRLAESGYRPYRDLVGGTLRHAGGLRLDHAMQVSRLWWIPEGGSAADGAYVRYDAPALLAVLAHEANLAGAVLIGEDLGTVDPWFREDMADWGALGTSLLWFERTAEGLPKPPGEWRRDSLATVGSHDMPPIRGFLAGDHVALRDGLGLLTRPPAEELADHRRQAGEWLSLLRAEGLLGEAATEDEIVAALHLLLARTPALLVGIALTDAVGERRTQNQPGTDREYPNWRVPLADATGHPILLDDLPENPRVTALARAVHAAL